MTEKRKKCPMARVTALGATSPKPAVTQTTDPARFSSKSYSPRAVNRVVPVNQAARAGQTPRGVHQSVRSLRQNQNEKLRSIFVERPLVLHDAPSLAAAANSLAVHSRISDLRKKFGLDIQNITRHVEKNGMLVPVSHYYYVPRGARDPHKPELNPSANGQDGYRLEQVEIGR
jgi:hypothetical protein